ncbi:MAG: SUMF1/EgtB/PvdO family nonheme iron enzyme [Pseudomonadota bacterium]
MSASTCRFIVFLLLSAYCSHGSTLAAEPDPQETEHLKTVAGVGTFVRIPAGEYVMGSQPGVGQNDERPTRLVRVAEFWLMQTEVTRRLFKEFASQSNHSTASDCWYFHDGWKQSDNLSWRAPGFEQTDNHPVTCVSWHDAKAFIRWLNQRRDATFRLPTEAEWEYAARAGSTQTHYFDLENSAFCHHANVADQSALKDYPSFSVVQCDDGFTRTSPVAHFQANPWGVYDLYGNVWEWVEDCWNTHYKEAPIQGEAWLDGDCGRRGFRGGGYGDIENFARSALRNRANAHQRKDDIGFRLVLIRD